MAEQRIRERQTYGRKQLIGGKMVHMRYHMVGGKFVPIQIVRKLGRTYVTHAGGVFDTLKGLAMAGAKAVAPTLIDYGANYLKGKVGSGAQRSKASSRARASMSILKSLSRR
jgi:hypothetical protein